MFSRSAVVVGCKSFLSRRISTQQDLLADALNTINSINPISRPGTPPIPTGPSAYPSPNSNPMSTQNAANFTLRMTRTPSHYRLDCHSTRNNTITTLSSLDHDPDQPLKPPVSKVIAWFSGGSVGFKKGQRGEYEAGYQCAVRMFKLLEDLSKQYGYNNALRCDLYFRGFGQGREAMRTALMSPEGENARTFIKRITDRTSLKIGGTRAKKTRRL